MEEERASLVSGHSDTIDRSIIIAVPLDRV